VFWFRSLRDGPWVSTEWATFGRRRPASARLLLSPSGAMAIEVRTVD
jgi:hypothetical protein